MDVYAAAQELLWGAVPSRAVALAVKCAGAAKAIRQAIRDLPQEGFLSLHYNADSDKLFLDVGDWMESDVLDRWRDTLKPLVTELQIEAEMGGPRGDVENWVKIAERPWEARVFRDGEKLAESPTLSGLATLGGYKHSPWLYGSSGPNPMVSLLASGLLGTGVGYGAGYLAEHLLPEEWQRGRMRRTGAVLGGLAGAALPAAWMASNVHQGKPFYQGHPVAPAKDYLQDPRGAAGMLEDFGKVGEHSETGFNGPWPEIPVQDFYASVWHDPRVTSRMPVQSRAALTGAVEGASALAGSPVVTPIDMARVAAGMGSGYLSGAIVGSILGSLMGMPEAAQNRLKNTGLWAGVANSMVPVLFGQ